MAGPGGVGPSSGPSYAGNTGDVGGGKDAKPMTKEEAKEFLAELLQKLKDNKAEGGQKSGGGEKAGGGGGGEDVNDNGIEDAIEKLMNGGKLNDADKSALKKAGMDDKTIAGLEKALGGESSGETTGGDTGGGGGGGGDGQV